MYFCYLWNRCMCLTVNIWVCVCVHACHCNMEQWLAQIESPLWVPCVIEIEWTLRHIYMTNYNTKKRIQSFFLSFPLMIFYIQLTSFSMITFPQLLCLLCKWTDTITFVVMICVSLAMPSALWIIPKLHGGCCVKNINNKALILTNTFEEMQHFTSVVRILENSCINIENTVYSCTEKLWIKKWLVIMYEYL